MSRFTFRQHTHRMEKPAFARAGRKPAVRSGAAFVGPDSFSVSQSSALSSLPSQREFRICFSPALRAAAVRDGTCQLTPIGQATALVRGLSVSALGAVKAELSGFVSECKRTWETTLLFWEGGSGATLHTSTPHSSNVGTFWPHANSSGFTGPQGGFTSCVPETAVKPQSP